MAGARVGGGWGCGGRGGWFGAEQFDRRMCVRSKDVKMQKYKLYFLYRKSLTLFLALTPSLMLPTDFTGNLGFFLSGCSVLSKF